MSKSNKRRKITFTFSGEPPTRMVACYYSETLKWNFAHFRLLRVFAPERSEIEGMYGCLFSINPGNDLGSLVHLRYLSLKTNFSVVSIHTKLGATATLKLQADECITYRIYFPPCQQMFRGSWDDSVIYIYRPTFLKD